MRERLVLAFVVLTVAVIGLYGLPRAYQLADLVQRQEARKVERSAELIADLVAEREESGRAVDERFLTGPLNRAERLEYVAPDGTRTTAGAESSEIDTGSDISRTRPVATGGEVTLTRSGDLVDERVSEALLPLVLTGGLLVLLAGAAGVLLARRLARPFSDLADQARRLGSGRFDLELPRYRVPEARRIGAALASTAEQLDELVRREREFSLNASHQLRTPITAMRLELEDLTLQPETPPGVSEQLHTAIRELDRLSAAITELLDLARRERIGDPADVDLAVLAAEAIERWQDRFTDAGRSIVQPDNGPVEGRIPPGPVTQVLDVLIENAADHGTGKVEVEAYELETHVQIRVRDEGAPDFGPEVFGRGVTTTGTGLGLAVASELAEAMGGYLSLETGAPTCFVLRLPKHD